MLTTKLVSCDLNAALEHAITQFEWREKVTGRRLPCDPDWPRVMRESLRPALAGERGDTDQEQCAYQAIRVTLWESGQIPETWTNAFPSALSPQPGLLPVRRIAWSRRWWETLATWSRSVLRRFNDWI